MARSDYVREYVIGNGKVSSAGRSGYIRKNDDSSFLGNLTYIGGNTAAGLGGVFEGIGRLVSSGVAKLAGDDRLARYYAKKSYIGEWQSDMAEKYSPGKVTQFFADAGAGVGQSSVFLLNLVAPGAGTVIFGAGVFGNSVGEAVNKTGQLGFKEYAYGGLSAGGELLMEKISGATFKAVGRIGAGVSGSLTKNAVETTATQTAKKGFLKAVASNAVLKDLLKESSGEFVEEFLGDFWDVGISRLTGVDPEASTTLGQAVYSGMVGFASGGLMSGSSMIINRAAAASRGYHINESGNAQQMVRTAEVVLEEAKTAENFQDPAGVVDMLKESVENYNAQKDKTNFASRVALGQMQMFTAYIEKNIGVMQAYTNIMKADAQTLEKYAQLASYYTNEKVTTRDLLNNRDNITTQMAIRDWVNGVLTVDSDLVAEAEVRDFTSTMEGGSSNVNADGTRFSVDGEATAQDPAAAEITQTDFDGEKSVQNVRVADNMYLSIKKNSDGTYNYAINDKSAKQDANGGVWDKTNVPAEEMRQYYEQAKEGAAQYEAQKAAQTTQETQTGTDGKTTAEGENAAQEQESAEEKTKEKPRQKSEIDSATEQKLNKMVKGFNTMAYRDRVAVSRMVKSAEANGVDAKTVKKIAIAMTARSGLDIRFTKSISQNGTWTVFKDGSQRRLILLNPDIQSPLEQTFLHEFMHDMMHDQYTNMKAVMDVTSGMLEKGAFDNYVRERRDEYFDACAKAGREGLILTKNEDGTVTRSFASEKAEKAFDLMMREEATANFGAEFLYRRGFLTRIARSNQKLVLRTFRAIGRWINDVRSRDMETARSLDGYLRTIEDAVRNSKGNSEIASLLSGSNPAAQTAETKSAAEKSETRFELNQFGQYTAEESSSIQRDARNKIAKSYDDVKRFISDSTSENVQKRLFLGKISKTTAKSILAQTDVYTYGKSIVLTSDDIRHIFDHHGSAFSEGQRGQIAITADNFDSVLRTIMEPDTVKPEVDKSGAISLVFKKEVDGNVTAVTVVSEKKKALSLKSAWITVQKEKQHISPPSDVQAPNPTSKTVGSMNAVSNNSIHQKAENVKRKSEIGENTRFELKIGNQTTPVKVQETKNLIAIHNLSEQKLLDTLDLGGFPMPSIAVVKADQGHSNYGDISVIFGRDTIDPKMNRTNKLYGSDAYTPTGSSVEYKVNRDAAKQFSRELSALARGIADGEYASDVSHAIDNLGDASSQSLPALIDSMSRRTGFQAAYLQSKGETVQPVYYKKEYSKYGGIEAVKNFIDILGSDAKQICLDVLEGDNSAWESQLENVKKAILDKYNDDPKKRALLERTIVSRYGASQVYDLVGGTWAYLDDLEHGQYGVDTKEVDRLATAQAIEEKIDFDDFRKWLTEKANGILGKKGIRNNKDPFTPSGNRRSFEQLHDDFTIDNIMRDMKKNQQARGQGTFGATAESVAAVATPEYKSISDMKKDSARLKIIDDQAYTQIKDDIGNQIIDIITDIKNANKIKTSNDFFVSDAIGSLIVGGGQLRSADSIIRYFANGGYSIDRNTANRILDVYRAVSAMPTGYFEAKPQRVVNFSEIKMVELPESASDTLKKQLERRKIPYEVYGKTDEDRATAVKKLNDVRFELPSKKTDAEYLELAKDPVKNKERLTAMVREAAEKAGYSDDSSWRMQHMAPNSKEDISIAKLKGSGLVPDDFWQHPEWYTNTSEERESYYKVKQAIESMERMVAIGKPARAYMVVYRAVDKTVNTKETGFRNGDWVTPSREYAVNEGLMNTNGYRIIGDRVDINNLYWDGNSLAELGYDDGKNYAYADTANYRKLLDPVTYDYDGSIIPLSKRFKRRNYDVRFELDSGTGYSRGQMSKIVANRTKGKVYSQTDAAIAIDNVTALVSEILSDDKASLRAKIRGKSRMEVIDFLFEQMNKEQGDGRLKTALQAADYILNHAVVQEELDSIGREEYARMVDIINGVESYRKKVKFTDTEKADLKHMFDKGYPSLLRAWSNKDGMMPSRILAELKESGVAVDSTSDVESDIFADLISQYQNAKQTVKQWNESVLLNTVGDKRMLTKLKSDMAHEILKAFETTGEKSTYRKEVEARQAYISKFLEDHRTKLNAARKRAMSESRLYRNAIKLDEQLKRDRRSSQLLSDDRMRKIAESAAKIGKPRNARNPLTVRDWAKSMQEIYSPKNPLLAIYGESDEKTGIFEHTYYSNEVGEALNRLTQIDTGKKFLTDEQIVDLDTVVSGITRLYRDYDTVYFQGKRQSLTETAQRGVDNMQWIADERAKKGQRLKIIDKFKRWTDAYLYEIASPMAVIHDMERHDPNGVLSAAFEEVVYGQIGAQTMFANLMDPFETFYKENKGYKKALARETVNFQGHELTKAQAISLYCTMKREHARLGLETFGIMFDDKDGNRVKTGALKGYDAKTLYNSFNETDKRFISLVENFFNDVSKKVKGDADMRILGSTNVLDDYYFPIQRDRSQRQNSVGDTRRGISDFLETVLNLSFNQNTVRHADGRIEISDVTNTIMKHAQGLAIYANLYEQIQTFDRILNKKVGEMDADGKLIRETTKSLGEMMEDNHKGMLIYLSKLMADVQGVRTDMTGPMAVMDHALTKVYGLYAQAAISGNIKTAILPLASYFATGLYVDARHMAKGFAMNASPAEIRANMEQMDKYSSVTKGRYYDRGAIKSQTVQDEVRGLISVTGKGIEATERFMLSKVWNACKSQTAEQLGLAIDSDENCRAAAKLFDKVVIETQSQYVASMKSAMGRSKNQLVRGLTMFKSDGAAMFSSSFDAIRRFMDLRDRTKSGQDVGKELAVAKKRAGRAVASVASVCVAVAIITQAMRYAFNNDDEEEETPAKNIAMNTMNSAMGMFPLIGDVYGVFAEGYDISNMTLDALNDGINGVRGMVSLFGDKNATQADVARATRKALYGVGHMAGIPVRNLTNLTTGVIRRISKPAMYGYDSIFSGEKYSEDLQRAVKRGDDKMAEAITKVMFRRKKTGAYNQETLDEVLRLYKAGYDKKVMPGGIPDGLTRAQRKTFLNVYGKSDADVQKLIESDAYKAFDDEQKASAINSLYRSWRAYAEYQATGETDDKSALLSEIMGADKFGKARAYLSGLKAKDNAETPKDGWRSTIQKGLKGMGLTSDEQALMLYAAGYHSTSDLSAFLRVLNARNLTKEQLALFAAIFKLDVKNGKLVERKKKTSKKSA